MRTIIFAPHVDDETIGCHQLLSKHAVHNVYYFFEHSGVREEEAKKAAKHFKFIPIFISDFDSFQKNFKLFFAFNDTILVPRIEDHHHDHQFINQFTKNQHSNLFYYSIDMNVNPDKYVNSELKKADLYSLYPSQKDYFDNHPQCYMFESVSDRDGAFSQK